MNRMIVFDDGLGQLGPMTDLRASFEVRTGAETTAARLGAHRPKTLAGYWVPEPLVPLVRSRADAAVNELPNEEILYCVNGRWAVPDPALDLDVGVAAVEEGTGNVVAACLRRAEAEYFLTTGQLHERDRTIRLAQRVLYRYPWEVVALLPETIRHDLAATRRSDTRVQGPGVATVGRHAVSVDRSARIGPNVVFDAEQGPVVVHAKAIVRPRVVLSGPCSIGPGSIVLDGAVIRPNTVVGPVCKVGGEVGATIFQGYANKSHDGHLGDSWVGEWVNLGAGTTNSNLLNTYGEVTMRVEPDGPRHRTGLTFMGAIIGDHVKTAIGTRLMTGTVVGTGAMIAGSLSVPNTVRRFAWVTDAGETTYRIDRFFQTMTRMMDRRDRTPSGEYLARVRDLHEDHVGMPQSTIGRVGR